MSNGDFDSESKALALVSAALGGTRFERTGGDSSKADGFVVLSDCSEIEVEVTRDVSERFMRSSAEIQKSDSLVELRHGSGSWVAIFNSESKLKDLHVKAQALVDDVNTSGRFRTTGLSAAFDYWFDGLRVGAIQKMAESPDQLVYAIQEVSKEANSFIDTSPDAIGNYAQRYIEGAGSPVSSGRRDSKFVKLAERAKRNGRSAHFAVVAMSPRNSGVWHALSRLDIGATWDYDLPREELALPEGVRGFWVLMTDFKNTVAFIEDRGWIRFPI
jgi:hypothetical protein